MSFFRCSYVSFSRNSPVDVVQSVGPVMRKSPGKKYGYIIIPVGVSSNIDVDRLHASDKTGFSLLLFP